MKVMIARATLNGPGYVMIDEKYAPKQKIKRGFICERCPDPGGLSPVKDISLSARAAGKTKDNICLDCYRELSVKKERESQIDSLMDTQQS